MRYMSPPSEDLARKGGGYSFEPRPNSCALGTQASVINQRMLSLEKPV